MKSTFAAISTGLTNSGISIVRMSGNQAVEIIDKVFSAKNGKKICEAAGIDPEMKVRDLTNEQENLIRAEVDKYEVEGELRREVQMNIKMKMEIGSYQGSRHKKGLPVHGQRTSRNARTRKGKGKVVANKKKVGK